MPYGVWDHDEHEETFYAHDLFRMLHTLVAVTDIKLVGGRLAMVGKPRSGASVAEGIAAKSLYAVERPLFIQKERRLLERINRLQKRIDVLEQQKVRLQESSGKKVKAYPHTAFFKHLSHVTARISQDRYAAERVRAKAIPVRHLLLPFHKLRMHIGMRLAKEFTLGASQEMEPDAVTSAFVSGWRRAKLHRKDIDRYFAENLVDFQAYRGLLSSNAGFCDLASLAKEIRYSVQEPQASLMLVRMYQSCGALEDALMVVKDCLFGGRVKLSNKDFKQLHREPVSRLLVRDLIPECDRDPDFRPGSRIGYVVHNSLPYVTVGYATRTQGFADGLLRCGQKLITISRPGFPLNVLPDTLDSEVPLSEEVEGVPYRRILAPIERGMLPFDYIKEAAGKLEETFRIEGIEIVIAASNYVNALPAIIAARRLGLPSVYEVRGFWEITAKSRDPNFEDTADYKTRVAMETLAVQSADRVLTLTEGMRDELIRRGVEPARIALAPNGIRPTMLEAHTDPISQRAELGIPESCPVIGYIGSITPYEGLEDLATACVGLHDRGIDFRFLIVGSEKIAKGQSTTITDHIINTFSAAGMLEKLIIVGRVPYEDVPSYYRIVDIAPIPRKPFEVSELVSPIKPLEAMAFETAVVVSSVAALTEIVTDGVNGYVFEKGNVAALEDTLYAAITQVDTRREIAAEGKRFAFEERAWEKIAANVCDFLFGSDVKQG